MTILKRMALFGFSLFLLSGAEGAGARFKPWGCKFAIPRSNSEVFTGYGASKDEAKKDALRACKLYHERMIPRICDDYYAREIENPGTFMSCKYNPGWEI